MRDYSDIARSPYRDLFFPDEFGRLEMVVRSMILNLILWKPFEKIVKYFIKEDALNITVAIFLLLLSIVLAIGYIWAIIVPRLRDMNWNKHIAWIMFIPYVNAALALILLFAPGKAYNRNQKRKVLQQGHGT